MPLAVQLISIRLWAQNEKGAVRLVDNWKSLWNTPFLLCFNLMRRLNSSHYEVQRAQWTPPWVNNNENPNYYLAVSWAERFINSLALTKETCSKNCTGFCCSASSLWFIHHRHAAYAVNRENILECEPTAIDFEFKAKDVLISCSLSRAARSDWETTLHDAVSS